MADPKQIDRLMQSRLTKSIQKAASLALVSDKDRSQIIAEQLTKDNIPKELTKVAAQAFNRRLAVRTIGVRPDENKADEFPIADIEKVASLRGIAPMGKVASIAQITFSFDLHEAPRIRKVASVKIAEKSVPMSLDQFQTKVQNLLDKKAAQFQNNRIQLMVDQRELDELHKKASKALAEQPKTVQLLKAKYGNSFDNVFPEFKHINKTASYAIISDNEAVRSVQKVMLNTVVINNKQKQLEKSASYLSTLAKSAAAIDADIKEKVLVKKADGYSVVKDVAANTAAAPILAALGFGKGVGQQAANTFADARDALFSKEYAVNPASAITANMLATDKYDDTKMALIRILSNPQFKSYPAAEINQAVMDQIANNPNFESPKYNRLLQVSVNQHLLNQGKSNLATLAAQSTALKALMQGRQIQDEMSAKQSVKGLKDKTTRSDINWPTLDALRDNSRFISGLSLPANVGPQLEAWKKDRQAMQLKAIDAADKLDRERAQQMKELAANRLKAQMHLAFTRAQQLPTWSNKKYSKPITSLNQLSKNDFQKMVAAGKQDFANLSPDKQQALIDYVSTGSNKKKS